MSVTYSIFNKTSAMVITVGLVLFFIVPSYVFAAESIENYVVDIHVTKHGQLNIIEQITYDFDNNQRHGIYRTIPLDQVPDDASTFYQERYIKVTLKSISRNGELEPYKLVGDRTEFSVRIGDPNITHTGDQTYTINYQVDGAIVDFTDGPAGIYWNAIGNQWDVPIKKATITLIADEGIFSDEVSECYLGSKGSQQGCEKIISDDSFVYQIDTTLNPSQSVTVLQSIDANQVAVKKLERIKFWMLLFGALGIGGLATVITIYRFRTKYKLHEPELVQYEPYQDTRPMYAGVLIDGKLHSRDITAGIVYLAQQGYIKIKKLDTKVLWLFSSTDYEIIRQKDLDGRQYPFLYSVFSLLFPETEKVIKLSDLKKDSVKQRKNYSIINTLKRTLQTELTQAGFYEQPLQELIEKIKLTSIIITFFLFVGLIWVWFVFFPEFIFLLLLLGILLVGLIIGLHRRLTEKGYRAQNRLRGFRKYLSMTEKERYAFHNDPAKNPDEFMQYLPYAIAFGVEDKWAKVFKDVSIPQPDWYEGSSVSNFNAVALTSSLNNFSSVFTQSSGSVSSSGGSAGGGAGGGGGGSW